MNEPARKLLPFTFHVKTTEFLLSQGFSKTIEERFWAKVDKNGPMPNPLKYPELKTQCWVWTASIDEWGYGRINNGYLIRTSGLAHRVSWILHFGMIPNGFQVLHYCDNTTCVRPDHTWLGTTQDNTYDCVKKGRNTHAGAPPGEKNGNAKLTEASVKEIKSLYPALTQRAIASRFGISQSTVSQLVVGIRWKHL